MEVSIILHGGIDAIPLIARATVVCHEDSGPGIHFDEVDLESVEHLRNMITFNAEDPDDVWEDMHGGQLPHAQCITMIPTPPCICA